MTAKNRTTITRFSNDRGDTRFQLRHSRCLRKSSGQTDLLPANASELTSQKGSALALRRLGRSEIAAGLGTAKGLQQLGCLFEHLN